jgi:hypothetical protein
MYILNNCCSLYKPLCGGGEEKPHHIPACVKEVTKRGTQCLGA